MRAWLSPATLVAFTDRYNQAARPFNWKFTAPDLARLLGRTSARQGPAGQTATPPEAAWQTPANLRRQRGEHRRRPG